MIALERVKIAGVRIDADGLVKFQIHGCDDTLAFETDPNSYHAASSHLLTLLLQAKSTGSRVDVEYDEYDVIPYVMDSFTGSGVDACRVHQIRWEEWNHTS